MRTNSRTNSRDVNYKKNGGSKLNSSCLLNDFTVQYILDLKYLYNYMTPKKITKYGNSLAVVLPKEVTESLSLDAGMLVSVVVKDGGVFIRAVEMVPGLTSEDRKIVDDIFSSNREVFEELAKQ